MNKIMVLGTFHMQAQNDMKNFQQSDRIVDHEKEITQIVEALATFNPTRIAVEREKNCQFLQKEYRRRALVFCKSIKRGYF